MRTTAASAMKIFLLPPLAESASLPRVPPKVNEWAGDTVSWAADVPGTIALLPRVSGPGMTVAGLSEVSTLGAASRAGAGALAAPAESPTQGLIFGGVEISDWPTVNTGLDSETGVDTVVAEATCSDSALTDSVVFPDSATPLKAEAEKMGAGFCAGSGTCVTADIGRVEATLGTSVGFAGSGVEAAGFGGGAVVVAAGLLPSFLRRRPRATRSVPFACSTLMGLVRTRFAPIRNAFATPACPSTTATARADWLFGELRELLNSTVAFCSLSQSTTTASKCSPINFFTAAKGSEQETTSKSNSLRTCVTVRAVFSSGQKSSAW